MKTYKFFFILLSMAFMQWSFTDDKNPLIGFWVYDSYDSENSIFIKSDKFDPDKPGIQFNADGTLLKRQNVGWCGTPPISYGNYEGTWKKTSDSTLTMRYKYWGGEAEQDLVIVKLSVSKLQLKYKDVRYFEK